MTATNHVLTGILVASVAHNPIIALPLAILSHFMLDALPHYSDPLVGYNSFRFKVTLGLDAYLAFMIIILVWLLHPAHVWLYIFCGVAAASPDVMWLPDFIAALRHQPEPVYGPVRRFHHKIQRYAQPNGAYVEAAWFVAVFIAAFGFTI